MPPATETERIPFPSFTSDPLNLSNPLPGSTEAERLALLQHENEQLKIEVRALQRHLEAWAVAEQEWLQRKHLFKLMTEHVADLIAIVDPRGHRIWNNSSYFKILGYNEEELRDSYSFTEVHPEDQAKVAEAFARTRETGQGQRIEYRMQHKNGSWVYLESDSSPVLDDNKQLDCVVLISRDITERKKFEDEMITAKTKQSVSDITTEFARDFQEFLSYAITKLKLNRGPGGLPDEEIERALKRAQDMTERLLKLAPAKAESENPLVPTALEPLVRSVVTELLLHTRCRSEFIFPRNLPEVEIDADAISQAVRHIMINAMQAADGGFFRISAGRISPESFKQKGIANLVPGHYVRLSIQDNGHGMSESIIARATEPYFTTRKGAQGMGLALTQTIIQRHKGALSIESVAGLGTTVSIYLPFTPEASGSLSSKGPTLSQTNRPRALLMDDEEMVLDITSRMLDHLGYEVTTCHDGAQTIAAFSKARALGHTFDVVLLDLMVPRGIGGIDAIHTIKKISPAARVIVCSGQLDHPAMLNHAQFGFAAALPKPYQIEKLQKVLDEVRSPA